MSDLVGNPEDRFSRVAALFIHSEKADCFAFIVASLICSEATKSLHNFVLNRFHPHFFMLNKIDGIRLYTCTFFCVLAHDVGLAAGKRIQ